VTLFPFPYSLRDFVTDRFYLISQSISFYSKAFEDSQAFIQGNTSSLCLNICHHAWLYTLQFSNSGLVISLELKKVFMKYSLRAGSKKKSKGYSGRLAGFAEAQFSLRALLFLDGPSSEIAHPKA